MELGELYDRARLSVGEGDAQIFVIHQMLITDEQYDSSIRTKILDEHFNADYAEMDGIHFMGKTYEVMLSYLQKHSS